jgi:hypothetical protein
MASDVYVLIMSRDGGRVWDTVALFRPVEDAVAGVLARRTLRPPDDDECSDIAVDEDGALSTSWRVNGTSR